MRIGVAVLLLGRALAVAGARPGFDEEAVQASSALEEKAVRVHAHDAAQQGGASNASRASLRKNVPVKVMQLNILADGMKEVELPKGMKDKDRPTILSNKAKTTEALGVEPLPVANLLDPKEVGIETEFSTRRVNWNLRKNAILDLVRQANPDVITMQEVDHYEEMAVLLDSWGYTSIRPPPTDGGDPSQSYSLLMLERAGGVLPPEISQRLKEMDTVIADGKTKLKGLKKEQEKLQQAAMVAEMEQKIATENFEAYEDMLVRCQEQNQDETGKVEVDSSDIGQTMSVDLDCGPENMKAIEQMYKDSNDHRMLKAHAAEGVQFELAEVERNIENFPQEQQELVDTNYTKHLALLGQNGIAFAPKGNSNARKVWKLNNRGRATKMEELLKDDEGSVIFWRSSKLKLASGEIDPVLVVRQEMSIPGDSKAAVRVILESVDDPKTQFAVITTHLASGAEKELRRQFELNSIYHSLKAPIEEILPVIFSADLNSDINFNDSHKRIAGTPMQKQLQTCCFNLVTGLKAVQSKEPLDKDSTKFTDEDQMLTGWRMESVYRVDQSELEGGGHRPPREEDRRPPTVLKMRGPGTAQPHKMGEFQMETIDHIFYSNPDEGPRINFEDEVELFGPVLPPMTALQMRAYSQLLDEGIAMGEEVASGDGTLYWRRGARDSNIVHGKEPDPIALNGLTDYMLQDRDWELNEITQHMLPSFFHPSDHLALVAEFDVYPPAKKDDD